MMRLVCEFMLKCLNFKTNGCLGQQLFIILLQHDGLEQTIGRRLRQENQQNDQQNVRRNTQGFIRKSFNYNNFLWALL